MTLSNIGGKGAAQKAEMKERHQGLSATGRRRACRAALDFRPPEHRRTQS